MMVIFFFTYLSVSELDTDSVIALSVLVLSIFFTVAEFMFISKTVKGENHFYISATPSVSLMLVGLLLALNESISILFIGTKLSLLFFISGILFFTAYYSSIIRYRYLPPGIAEYPALLTYFVLLPVDVFLFNKSFNVASFLCAILVLLALSILLNSRLKDKLTP